MADHCVDVNNEWSAAGVKASRVALVQVRERVTVGGRGGYCR